MIHGKCVVPVMPACVAEQTFERVYNEIPFGFVDGRELEDDASPQATP